VFFQFTKPDNHMFSNTYLKLEPQYIGIFNVLVWIDVVEFG